MLHIFRARTCARTQLSVFILPRLRSLPSTYQFGQGFSTLPSYRNTLTDQASFRFIHSTKRRFFGDMSSPKDVPMLDISSGLKRSLGEADLQESEEAGKKRRMSKSPTSEVDGDPTSTTKITGDLEEVSQKREFKTWKSTRNERQGDKGKIQSRRAVREAKAEMKAQGKRRGTRVEGGETGNTGESRAPRLPKRQCALLIGFCGAGYNGMQIQPDVKTIEGTLFNALVKAGGVSQDNADDPVKVNLGRAARTDAGVHAAGNVVSMKLITEIPGVPDLVARINEELPPEIRLWDFIRVQNSFNARSYCDSRKYTYLFPSYLLIPPKPGSGLHETIGGQDTATSELYQHPFWAKNSPGSTREEDLLQKRQWRVSNETVETLRAIAKQFEGSHNFHNFTVARDYNDKSAQRFMKKIEIADPVVYGGTEWISVLLHGQSFMLHQRKMIAALVLACRTSTPPQIIDEMYGPRMLFVPKMPALGLLLEYPIFESYNRKMEGVSKNLQPSDSEYRPPIDFEAHRPEIDRFKDEHIYSRMRTIEDSNGIFDAWVRSVDKYKGNDLLYLNNKGVIPSEAVIKRGERRSNPFRERKRFDTTSFPERKDGDKTVIEEEEEEEEEEEVAIDKKQLADMEG